MEVATRKAVAKVAVTANKKTGPGPWMREASRINRVNLGLDSTIRVTRSTIRTYCRRVGPGSEPQNVFTSPAYGLDLNAEKATVRNSRSCFVVEDGEQFVFGGCGDVVVVGVWLGFWATGAQGGQETLEAGGEVGLVVRVPVWLIDQCL